MSNKYDIAPPLSIILAAVGAVVAVALTVNLPAWLTLSLFLWQFWSLTALLFLADTPRRDFIQGTLRHSRFTQIYSVPTKRIIDLFWTRYCDEPEKDSGPIQTFRHALTWKLYDKAMLFAGAYPILLLTLFWLVTGNDAKLGDAIVLPAAIFWPDRAVTFGSITIVIAGVTAKKMAAASRHRIFRLTADWLPFLAVAFPFAFVVTGAIPVAGTVAVAVTTAVAFSVAFPVAGAIAVTFAVAGAVAIAGAIAVAGAFGIAVTIALLDICGKPQLARWLATLILPIGWLILFLALPWVDISLRERAFFLFLGVLPLINALFDVVSYAVTLTLLRLGLRARHPILNGLADLAIAMVLFLALGACLTALITAMNVLAQTTIFDLNALFDGIHAAPNDYYWLYLMMFSTLLPTAAHGAITLLGLQGITPRFIRRRVADLIKASPTRTFEATAAPLAVGAVWSVPFLITGWGLYLVWPHIGGWVTGMGWLYLDTLAAFAQVLGN